LILIVNTDSSKEQSNKIQQFPLSSYELFIGKYLEKAVDKFIDSKYTNNVSEDEEINYLAFFGTNTEMKKFLANECKLRNNFLIFFIYCKLKCFSTLHAIISICFCIILVVLILLIIISIIYYR